MDLLLVLFELFPFSERAWAGDTCSAEHPILVEYKNLCASSFLRHCVCCCFETSHTLIQGH